MYKKPVNSNMSRSYFLSTVSENFAFLAGQWEIFDSVWRTLATGLLQSTPKTAFSFDKGCAFGERFDKSAVSSCDVHCSFREERVGIESSVTQF